MSSRAFYTVADARFFPGVVALYNSLRILGHEEPLTVLDCGLTAAQRALLEQHAKVVPNRTGLFAPLAKWYAPLREPADVMVHVDADIIVVRPLASLLELASGGRVMAISSGSEHDRFFPEWETLLGLGPLRRRPHVQAGFVVLPRDPGIALMRRMTELVQVPDLEESRWGPSGGKGKLAPFYYPEQDVMNALFSAELPDDRITVMEPDSMGPAGLSASAIRDRRTLECRLLSNVEPYVLHAGPHPPWIANRPPSAYSVLLSRLLFWDDVTIRLDPRDFPLALRPGPLPDLVRRARRERASAASRLRAGGSLARAALRDPARISLFLMTHRKALLRALRKHLRRA